MLNMQGQTFLMATTALRNAIKLGVDILINPQTLAAEHEYIQYNYTE